MNIVVLGISTGGPNTLRSMFRGLERLDAAMVLVQHMPRFVNAPLSRSLNELTDMDVVVAQHDQTLHHGWVYVAPSESHTRLRDNRTMQLWHGPKVNFVQPSVDVTMQSLQASAIDRLAAVVMTGMGADGAAGLAHVKGLGGTTFAQDERSSVIYGMPAEAVRTGCVDFIMSPAGIARKLSALFGVMRCLPAAGQI